MYANRAAAHATLDISMTPLFTRQPLTWTCNWRQQATKAADKEQLFSQNGTNGKITSSNCIIARQYPNNNNRSQLNCFYQFLEKRMITVNKTLYCSSNMYSMHDIFRRTTINFMISLIKNFIESF